MRFDLISECDRFIPGWYGEVERAGSYARGVDPAQVAPESGHRAGTMEAASRYALGLAI
jgi:hypothetical protein